MLIRIRLIVLLSDQLYTWSDEYTRGTSWSNMQNLGGILAGGPPTFIIAIDWLRSTAW